MAGVLGNINKSYVSSINFLDQREILNKVLDITNEEMSFLDIMELTGRSKPTSVPFYNHFVNEELFQNMLKKDELLEYANVYGNWYGVPKKPIRDALRQGFDVIVKVDVQGAANIKRIVPQALFIFLMPPSLEELANRLNQRYTESPQTLSTRLQAASDEIEQSAMFDYQVINHSDQIESAIAEIKSIIDKEKRRPKPRDCTLP